MSQSDNRLHLRCWVRTLRVTSYRRGAFHMPPPFGIPLCNRRRTPEPPLCKGRCRASRGGGVVPDTNYLFLFCSAKSKPLQSIRRSHASSLYRGSFLGVQTLQRTFCLFRRARACSRRSLYLIRRYFSELLNNLESSKKRLHAWRDCGTIKAEKRRLFAAVTAETEKENQNGDFWRYPVHWGQRPGN